MNAPQTVRRAQSSVHFLHRTSSGALLSVMVLLGFACSSEQGASGGTEQETLGPAAPSSAPGASSSATAGAGAAGGGDTGSGLSGAGSAGATGAPASAAPPSGAATDGSSAAGASGVGVAEATDPVGSTPAESGGAGGEPGADVSSPESPAGEGGQSGAGGAAMGAGGASGSGGMPPEGTGAGGQTDLGTGGAVGDPVGGEFSLSSPSWDVVDNDECTPDTPEVCPVYPEELTGLGAGTNTSPAMSWPAGPEGTMSYAITLIDRTTTAAHWVLWDIPGDVTMLPEGLPNGTLTEPAGARQAANYGQTGHFGSGACGNVYEYRLYALGVANLNPADTAVEGVRSALESSTDVLATSFARMQSRDYCTMGGGVGGGM